MAVTLTNQQQQKLYNLLLAAFPNLADLAQMVKFGLDKNLAEIAGGGNLQSVVFDLLTWAGSRDKYGDLIAAALAANSDHPGLRDFAASVGVPVPLRLAAPADTPPPTTSPPPAAPVSPPAPATTAATTPYEYDVFVSYASTDSAWVQGELVPALKQAGLRVCIDTEDFLIGLPIVDNIQRAVDKSRFTIIVMTAQWVASRWTAFEAQLVTTSDPSSQLRRLIPIMLEGCDPPTRIQMLTYADFTNPTTRPAQIARLIRQLQAALQP